jgi:aldose 1-epimerase
MDTTPWRTVKPYTISAILLFKNIVFYTPLGEEFFAIEPVTNCNNGFNMAEQGIRDTGTLYLKPGEEVSGEIRLKVDSIY